MAVTGNRICGFTQKMHKNARSCAKPLTIDLSENAQKRAGDIFGVLKAEASEKNCDALAAHIEDALVRGVFESLRKLPNDASQEAILEAAVAKVNDALFRLLGEDGLSLGPETISGAVISQKGKDVSAAVWGRPSILLFHPISDGQVHIYDLVEDEESETKNGRGFSQIISGRITGRDRLLVASDDLRNPLGDDALAELILRDDPESAMNALRQSLSSSRMSFALSVFVSDGVEIPLESKLPGRGQAFPRMKTGTKLAKTDQSIENLIATESKTSQIMSPPVLPTIKNKTSAGLKVIMNWLPNRIKQWKQEKEEDAVIAGQKPAKKRLDDDEPPPAMSNEGGGQPPEANEETLAEQSVALSPKEAVDAGLTNLIDAINLLPKISKVGLVVLLFALTLMNFSSIAVGWKNARKELAKMYEYNITQIEQKMDSAEASLIYRDDNRAKDLLGQAEAMIVELPENSKEQKMNKKALTLQLQEKQETANRAVRLLAPDVVASLNNDQGPIYMNRLARMNQKVFASADNGKIFEIDSDGGAREAGESPKRPTLFLADERRLISATAEGSLLTISPAGQASEGTLSWGNESVQPKDAVVWGSRLYVLDAAHNRLLKHYATNNGFGSPQFYLKDGTDVSDGISIAVDGNLYVLNNNGQVSKIRLGKLQEFELGPVEPSLTKANRIRTGPNDDNLWILDVTERRLLGFDKETGELQAQYLHEKFAGTADFLIDEANLEVMTIKGNNILRFKLPE